MPWLFLLFVLVPAIELALLIQIGSVIGVGNTFILILATGVLGSWLTKNQGLATWRALNERWSSGQIPGKELMDGAIILFCGALLLTPGVITDVIGFLGLIPASRMVFRKMISGIFTAHPGIKVGVHVGSHMNARAASRQAQREPQPQDSPGNAGRERVHHPAATVSGSAKSRPSYVDPESGA